MAEKAPDFITWTTRVTKASSAKEVFALLDEFRKADWTDEERSRMAKVYMRVLDRVGGLGPEDVPAEVLPDKDDGPVWYEKM